MKKLLAVFLTICLLASLAACTPSQNAGTQSGSASAPAAQGQGTDAQQGAASDPASAAVPAAAQSAYAPGRPVPHAEPLRVLRKNNISFLRRSIRDEDGNTIAEFVQITGLKDAAVQKRINAAITTAVVELTDWSEMPAYTGIRLAYAPWKDQTPRYRDVYTDSWCANFGNILSLEISSSISYCDSSWSKYFSVSRTFCLNFDLNTGLPIRLADLFADDVDAQAWIDGAVRDAIRRHNSADPGWDDLYFGSDGQLVLADSFPGIREDQKFCITSGGQLTLVFDDATPWVLCRNYYPQSLVLDISEVSALGSRFESDSSLFTDETPRYTLAYNSFPTKTMVERYEYTEPYDGREGVGYHENFEYSTEMPDYLIAHVVPTDEEIERFKGEVLAQVDAYEAEYPGRQVNVNFGWYGHADRVGDYTNVSLNHTAYYYLTEEYQDLGSVASERSLCFKEGSEEPLALEDLFVSGADVKALIGEAMLANLKYYTSITDSMGPLRRFVRKAIDLQTGFQLRTDSLNFSYEGGQDALDALIKECFPNSEEDWPYRSIVSSATFEDIGCENLTIFR